MAGVLGVTRRTLHSWKERKDAGKLASNGPLDVTEWCEFTRRNDLKGREPGTAVSRARTSTGATATSNRAIAAQHPFAVPCP